MSNPRPVLKNISLHRATADTLFFVDYEWWENSNLDLKTYVLSRLSLGDEQLVYDSDADQVDIVDMKTGEVRQVDGFQYALQTYFKQLPEDFATRTSLVDAAFCILLGNANQPMSARELAEKVGRSPDVIVKTLGGPRVYQGIRPIFDDN